MWNGDVLWTYKPLTLGTPLKDEFFYELFADNDYIS